MSIVFYAAPYSSATPVSAALAELEVEHERVPVDLAAGEQKDPAFLKLNPNGKVPTLVADGTPMFEGLAIILWLGDRFGIARGVWPATDAPARMQALSWSVFAYVSYLTALRRWHFAASEYTAPELRNEAHAAHAADELETLKRVLDGHLSGRDYLLGETFSLADLVAASVVGYGVWTGSAVDDHAHVAAWLARCQARPSMQVA